MGRTMDLQEEKSHEPEASNIVTEPLKQAGGFGATDGDFATPFEPDGVGFNNPWSIIHQTLTEAIAEIWSAFYHNSLSAYGERCRLELFARMHDCEELMTLSTDSDFVKKYLDLRRSRRDAVEVIAGSSSVRRRELLQRRNVAAVAREAKNDAPALHDADTRLSNGSAEPDVANQSSYSYKLDDILPYGLKIMLRVDYGVPPGNSVSGTEVGAAAAVRDAHYSCINDAGEFLPTSEARGEDKAAGMFSSSKIVPPRICVKMTPGVSSRNRVHPEGTDREYLRKSDIGGKVTDEDATFASVYGLNRNQAAGLVGHERTCNVPGRPGALNIMHGTLKPAIVFGATFCITSTFLVQGVGAIAPETAPDRSLQTGSSTGTLWITVVTVIVGILSIIVPVVLWIVSYNTGLRQDLIQTAGFNSVSSSLDLGFQQVCRTIEDRLQRLNSSQNIEKDDVGTGSASAALQPHAVLDIPSDEGEMQ